MTPGSLTQDLQGPAREGPVPYWTERVRMAKVPQRPVGSQVPNKRPACQGVMAVAMRGMGERGRRKKPRITIERPKRAIGIAGQRRLPPLDRLRDCNAVCHMPVAGEPCGDAVSADQRSRLGEERSAGDGDTQAVGAACAAKA